MRLSSFIRQALPGYRLFVVRRRITSTKTYQKRAKSRGEDALQFSVRTVLTQTEAILKSLPAIVQANRIDALIIDTVQFYAELGAMQLGIPYVHVANGVHWDYSGYTPLCLYGWPHETTSCRSGQKPGRSRKMG